MTSRIPFPRADVSGSGQDCAVDALLQLREARSESARTRLQAKQAEIATLQREIEKIEAQRAKVTSESRGEVLQARILLDGLTRALLDRKRELRRLGEEAGSLLKEFMGLRGQSDSVRALRDRRAQAEEYVRERRAEAAACDAAAARSVLRPATEREGPCQE